MQIAFGILLALILSSLATVVADGPIVNALVGGAAAIALAFAAFAIRPLEGAHLVKSVRPLLPLMALPALWMVIQELPLPITTLAHPIWASARDAMNGAVMGHMTIDIGDTLIALGRYSSAAAIVLVAAIVGIDRQRAEWILWLLSIVATVAAMLLLVDWMSGSALLAANQGNGDGASLAALACVGVTLAATAADRAIERYETRRMAGQTSLRGFLQMLAACLAALAICAVAVIYAAPAPLVLATAGGVAMLAIIVIIRRLGLGLMAGGALVALAALGAGIAAVGQTGASSNPTLRFATSVTQAKLSVVERMITDNGIGSGAGTFAALLPLYANFDDASLRAAPTLAAQISIEMGKAAPFIAAVLALMLVAILLRGAFERGRDSFYAAGAAACTVTFLTEAFMDSSLLTTSAMLVAATILGLGFAQRLSRSLQ